MRDLEQHHSDQDNQALQPWIDAARADEPGEAQWEGAKERLRERLAAATMQPDIPSWTMRLMGRLFGQVRQVGQVRHVRRARALGWALGAAALLAVVAVPLVVFMGGPGRAFAETRPTAGQLRVLGPDGQPAGLCPLEHTDVTADVVGFVSRVTVRQRFHNTYSETIDAVYVFPLPADSAVDGMTMTIGERRIVGRVKPREEARQMYQAARQAGQVAALLDQERPNIFTQSVANIEPGAVVEIEITYNETLKYEDGEFEFVFPMVVGPRYSPGGTVSPSDASDPSDATATTTTTQVPDAPRITPPVSAPETRAGHDIDVTVHLDTGIEIENIATPLHEVKTEKRGPGRAVVSLASKREIPNRDFVLRYRLANDHIENALLTHRDERGAFFTLIVMPPRRVSPDLIVPKEMIFVIDRSGSMNGWKIEKAKETMKLCIQQMNPDDTFNLLSFSGGLGRCFEQSMPNTEENRATALKYLEDLTGSGGTEMMPAIMAALEEPASELKSLLDNPPATVIEGGMQALSTEIVQGLVYPELPEGVTATASPREQFNGPALVAYDKSVAVQLIDPAQNAERFDDGTPVEVRGHLAHSSEGGRALKVDDIQPQRVRVVAFMTDGQIGNDFEIIDAVRRNAARTRVFSFGVGNSTNRFLLEGIAREGRGEAQFVTESDDAAAAAERFYVKLHAPVLIDIAIDWGGLPVEEVYPPLYPDLYDMRPIMIHGRWTSEDINVGYPVRRKGAITLRGRSGEGLYESRIELTEDPAHAHHEALASLWARAKVGHLMHQDMAALQHGNFPPELRAQITQLGIDYHLMTQFTSFVAVEETYRAAKAAEKKVDVPAEVPQGEKAKQREEGVRRGRRYASPSRRPGQAGSEAQTSRSLDADGDGKDVRLNRLRELGELAQVEGGEVGGPAPADGPAVDRIALNRRGEATNERTQDTSNLSADFDGDGDTLHFFRHVPERGDDPSRFYGDEAAKPMNGQRVVYSLGPDGLPVTAGTPIQVHEGLSAGQVPQPNVASDPINGMTSDGAVYGFKDGGPPESNLEAPAGTRTPSAPAAQSATAPISGEGSATRRPDGLDSYGIQDGWNRDALTRDQKTVDPNVLWSYNGPPQDDPTGQSGDERLSLYSISGSAPVGNRDAVQAGDQLSVIADSSLLSTLGDHGAVNGRVASESELQISDRDRSRRTGRGAEDSHVEESASISQLIDGSSLSTTDQPTAMVDAIGHAISKPSPATESDSAPGAIARDRDQSPEKTLLGKAVADLESAPPPAAQPASGDVIVDHFTSGGMDVTMLRTAEGKEATFFSEDGVEKSKALDGRKKRQAEAEGKSAEAAPARYMPRVSYNDFVSGHDGPSFTSDGAVHLGTAPDVLPTNGPQTADHAYRIRTENIEIAGEQEPRAVRVMVDFEGPAETVGENPTRMEDAATSPAARVQWPLMDLLKGFEGLAAGTPSDGSLDLRLGLSLGNGIGSTHGDFSAAGIRDYSGPLFEEILQVRAFEIKLLVVVDDLSDTTRTALEQAGLKVLGLRRESNHLGALREHDRPAFHGTLDLRKLLDLAAVQNVRAVHAVAETSAPLASKE